MQGNDLDTLTSNCYVVSLSGPNGSGRVGEIDMLEGIENTVCFKTYMNFLLLA